MMRKKGWIKWGLIAVCGLLVMIIAFLCVAMMWDVASPKRVIGKHANFFSSIAAENTHFLQVPVTDIAMLGSHDAFTHKIRASSKSNESEDVISNNAFIKFLAGGMIARNSKAQADSVYDQLYSGVRYLDVRITHLDGNFYTCHGLINDSLESGLKDVLKFLSENAGEFIVFHIQHYYTGESDWNALAAYLASVRYEGRSFYDFMRYDTDKSLKDITYREATDDGRSGGIVLVAERNDVSNEYREFYQFDEIRSNWHNKNRTGELLNGIAAEYAVLTATDRYQGMFRINQAQLTPKMSEIFKMIFDWSLLSIAEKHNNVVLSQPAFSDWLNVMPIFMVDYATLQTDNFNAAALAKIRSYNLKQGIS